MPIEIELSKQTGPDSLRRIQACLFAHRILSSVKAEKAKIGIRNWCGTLPKNIPKVQTVRHTARTIRSSKHLNYSQLRRMPTNG
jgi:hypothetical protein